MDLMIRYNDGPGMSSPAGVVVYFGGHLQETKEAGGLEVCPGYLSRDGQVKPEAINADLWREVGWDPAKQELPPPELLRQLSMGYDLEGNKLTQGRGLFRQPKEALITLPAELSQSLKDHPEIARDILRAVVAAHVAEVEREAVRVRAGGGLREWHEARTLTLAYFHAENRGGEVHFHPHTMTFAPAKARAAFTKHPNLELSEAEEVLKLDLGKVLRKVEAMQAVQLAEILATKGASRRPALSEAEHDEALAQLKSPDLMTRIPR